jgi:hypothetical protein
MHSSPPFVPLSVVGSWISHDEQPRLVLFTREAGAMGFAIGEASLSILEAQLGALKTCLTEKAAASAEKP